MITEKGLKPAKKLLRNMCSTVLNQAEDCEWCDVPDDFVSTCQQVQQVQVNGVYNNATTVALPNVIISDIRIIVY